MYLDYKDDTKIQPRRISASLGENVHFICKSVSKVHWIFNRGFLPNRTSTLTVIGNQNLNVLNIRDIGLEHEGIYSCIGENIGIHKKIFQSSGYLQVVG